MIKLQSTAVGGRWHRGGAALEMIAKEKAIR